MQRFNDICSLVKKHIPLMNIKTSALAMQTNSVWRKEVGQKNNNRKCEMCFVEFYPRIMLFFEA